MSHNSIKTAYFKTPYGELIIGSFDDKLCLCDWQYRKMRHAIDSRIKSQLNAEYIEGSCELLNHTKEQLEEYFSGTRTTFEIPLLLVGSGFQKSVWEALLQIPFGTTETYSGLSRKLGNEKAIRAVATANGANALSIVVPCHRVIGSNGNMIGYAGGLEAKKSLLSLENALSQGQLNLF